MLAVASAAFASPAHNAIGMAVANGAFQVDRTRVSGNTTLSPNVPADMSTFAACPGPANNAASDAALGEMLGFVAGAQADKPETFETNWIRHDHAPQGDIKPLEIFSKDAWGQ